MKDRLFVNILTPHFYPKGDYIARYCKYVNSILLICNYPHKLKFDFSIAFYSCSLFFFKC